MSDFKIPPERKVAFYIKFVEYVNTNEFFWTADMRRSLNLVQSSASENPWERLARNCIRMLLELQLLGVAEKKGSFKQYYRMGRNIELNDIKQRT